MSASCESSDTFCAGSSERNVINTGSMNLGRSDMHRIPTDTDSTMDFFKMTLFGGLVLVSMCLPATIGDYGVAYSSPQPAPSYSYVPPPPAYAPQESYPMYYDTVDTNVDYREANNTRRCGIQPSVHRHGLAKDKVTFGEYPWVVAILDTYNNYKASGVLISTRHVLTAGNGVTGLNANDIIVRVGDYDLQTDHNYLEVYKNYEIPVCKKHFYYSVPQYGYDQSSQYGYSSSQQGSSYQSDATYDVVILELSEDVDLDQYPQVEPICLPDFYYRSKSYYKEYYSGYGKVVAGAGNSHQVVNEEGVAEDLDCWVVGYSYSPQEEIKYQTEKTSYVSQAYTAPAPSPPPSYGYGYSPPAYYPPQTYTKYVPAYSYESYSEYSLTPRRAKVHKVYEEYYQPPVESPPSYSPYGYGQQAPSPAPSPAPKNNYENWEADYYFDTCRADVGSAVMCKVSGKYEEEDAGKAFNSYVPYYQSTYVAPSYAPPPYAPPAPPAYAPPAAPAYGPPAPPSYGPPAPPAYGPPTPPAYSPPAPSAYAPPAPPAYAPPSPPAYAPPAPPAYSASSYSQPPYSPPRYRRGSSNYQSSYSPPAYSPQVYSPPAYSPPAYSPPAYSPPAYSPPAYSPPAYSPPAYDAPYKIPIDQVETLNEEYRRFAVFGIVTYPTQCSYDSYDAKKLKVTPIKEVLPWVLNVIHSPVSQCSPPQPSYTPPSYDSHAYDYQPPSNESPAYAPPAYESPSYSPSPNYQPPSYSQYAASSPIYY